MAGILAANDHVLFMFLLEKLPLKKMALIAHSSGQSRFLTVATLIDLFDCRVYLLFVFALHWLGHCGFICLPDSSNLVRVTGSFKDLSSSVSLARSLNKWHAP